MASRFMKIKRVIIPFMTLVVMTSQLAGCATMTSDEMLKSMNESPDVSIEYAIPDPGKQSLDATQVLDTDGQQIVSDSHSDIGLIEDQNNQKLMEKSTLATAAKSNTTSSKGSWSIQLPFTMQPYQIRQYPNIPCAFRQTGNI